MLAFQREVLRLQAILRTCEEVRAIVSAVALEGSRVAEEANEVLGTLVDSDTLVGDEIANEAEDYE
jgi:predicted metal-dependent enzyme (double-stranded beta helix superfamily)